MSTTRITKAEFRAGPPASIEWRAEVTMDDGSIHKVGPILLHVDSPRDAEGNIPETDHVEHRAMLAAAVLVEGKDRRAAIKAALDADVARAVAFEVAHQEQMKARAAGANDADVMDLSDPE